MKFLICADWSQTDQGTFLVEGNNVEEAINWLASYLKVHPRGGFYLIRRVDFDMTQEQQLEKTRG